MAPMSRSGKHNIKTKSSARRDSWGHLWQHLHFPDEETETQIRQNLMKSSCLPFQCSFYYTTLIFVHKQDRSHFSWCNTGNCPEFIQALLFVFPLPLFSQEELPNYSRLYGEVLHNDRQQQTMYFPHHSFNPSLLRDDQSRMCCACIFPTVSLFVNKSSQWTFFSLFFFTTQDC